MEKNNDCVIILQSNPSKFSDKRFLKSLLDFVHEVTKVNKPFLLVSNIWVNGIEVNNNINI